MFLVKMVCEVFVKFDYFAETRIYGKRTAQLLPHRWL